MQHRHFYYGPGTHYSTTVSSDEDGDDDDDAPPAEFANRQVPRGNWRGLVNRKSKRTVRRPLLNWVAGSLRRTHEGVCACVH